jgi:multimeric flavodoxin WrbA
LNILAIIGSPRLDGNTNYLTDIALEEARKSGAQTEKITISQYKVNPCLGHVDCADFDSCQQRDDVSQILDKFCQADGVILATPVYYYNVSAQMKIFIDRNYFLYKHDQKSRARAVGIIVVAGGDDIDDTLRTLKHFLSASFNVSKDRKFEVCGSASQPGDVKDNLPLIEQARQLGTKIVEALKKEG